MQCGLSDGFCGSTIFGGSHDASITNSKLNGPLPGILMMHSLWCVEPDANRRSGSSVAKSTNGFSLAQVSTRSWLGLLYLITFGSLVGFVAYGWLLQNAPISLVSTYAYVNPIIAVLLGALFANEALEPRIWLAAGIIIGSVIFINSTRSKGQSKIKEAAVESH